ncbi:MAG: gliding motility-associated ABC transporter ATP-binding subunit GldA [Prolixibacteraceae bacterium]|jgi:ABC-2 type transport system ATP-binding protein|nr:gliding motility-associated ABC transporter ATP-binding subunit GldA [Prolixibacteraceae bacterium]
MSIQVENITKKYGQQLALNNVSFKVNTGEIVGFLGPNGAGKSTLMKILTGYILPNSGIARIEGLKVEGDKIDFRSRIGYLPENNPLYPEMYIKEYLHMVAGFYHLKNKKDKVGQMIEMTGLSPESKKKIGALSKGYRQRVGLAQALIHNPEVLILDEPTSGLDPNQLDEIRKLIISISKDKTVMLSTHIMQEVEAICNRILIINKGNLLADGTPKEINKMSKGVGQQVYFSTKEVIEHEFLTSLTFVAKAKSVAKNEYLITAATEEDIRPLLFNTAISNKWTLLSLHEKQRSVENIFRELTQ